MPVVTSIHPTNVSNLVSNPYLTPPHLMPQLIAHTPNMIGVRTFLVVLVIQLLCESITYLYCMV